MTSQIYSVELFIKRESNVSIPYEMIQLIQEFAYRSINDATIEAAVDLWCKDRYRNIALQLYGHISQWNTTKVTNTRGIFDGQSHFNDNIGSCNVRSVTDMSFMFCRAHSFNQPLNNWNVSSVTVMNSMFWAARSFNQPLNHWKVKNVQSMRCMFAHATSFAQSLSEWDVDQSWLDHDIYCHE